MTATKRLKHNRSWYNQDDIERIDRLRDRLGSKVGPPKIMSLPKVFAGVKQTFAMYVKQYDMPYLRQGMVELTRIGGTVSLESLYDFGRIPFTIGWGNGRVSWIGQKGSKWFNFHTWSEFRLDVFIRDNGICQKCGKVIAEKDKDGRWPYQPEFVCDHIIPLFKGGKDWHEDPEMLNFQTLCVGCNKVKTRHDVAKPHVIKQKLGLKTIQYAGFVFEQTEQKNTLDQFCFATSHAQTIKKES